MFGKDFNIQRAFAGGLGGQEGIARYDQRQAYNQRLGLAQQQQAQNAAIQSREQLTGVLNGAAKYVRGLPPEQRQQAAIAYMQVSGADENMIGKIQGSGILNDLSDQKLDAYLNSSRSEQVLKDKEVLLGRDGKPVYSNRYNAPQVVAQGSSLVGDDGNALYTNQAQPDLPTGMRMGANGPEWIPGYIDGQTTLKAAGRPTTSVTVGAEQPVNFSSQKFSEEMGKSFAQRAQTISSSAQGARVKMNRLKALSNALDNPNVYTGTGGNAVQELRRLGIAMGLDIDRDAVADADVINALGNQLALSMRSTADGEGMPGQLSDRDIQFLTSSVPNLSKTREGNRKLIEYSLKLEQRKIDVDKWKREYMRNNNGQLDQGFDDFLAQKVEENPLFDSAETPPQSGVARRRYVPGQGLVSVD